MSVLLVLLLLQTPVPTPEDPDLSLPDASRAEWQKPDRVVRSLGLRKGQTACDIGSGPGYFSLRLAEAVGPTGHVYAVDVEPRMLEVLRQRISDPSARNIIPVLALADDPMLPGGACDVILLVNTYHLLGDGAAYLARLTRSLRRGGRIVNIDYQKKETPVGPPVDERVSREAFLKDAESAGLSLLEEGIYLPYQYLLVLKPGRRVRP